VLRKLTFKYGYFVFFLDVGPSNINTANGDYSLAESDVTVPTGMNSAIYAVAIVDDTDVEETECFELVLSGPTTGALEDCHITTTICIKDDDTTSK